MSMFLHKQLIIKEDIRSKNIVVCRCLFDSMPSYLYSIHYFSLKYKNPPFCCNCSRFFSFFTRLQHDHYCPKSDPMIDVYFTFFCLDIEIVISRRASQKNFLLLYRTKIDEKYDIDSRSEISYWHRVQCRCENYLL